MHSLRTGAFLIAALYLTACGRSGSSPVLPSGGASGSFQIAITVPHATASTSSDRRSPAYIATTTQSVTVNVTAHGSSTSFGGYPVTANLTANSTGCTSTLVSTQCTITLTAAVGNDDVTITTYDGLNGTGSALSAAQTVEVAIVEGKSNTLPIVLGGIPTSVELIAGGAPVGGLQASVFTLTPSSSGILLAYSLDADGNVILGAGAPAITVTSSDNAAIVVTAPTSTAPNAIGISALGTQPIARVTVTATPVSGTGTGAVSATVTVQDPTLHVIYVADYGSNSIKTYDALGNQLASQGGFPGLSYPYTIDYDQANQLLYVGGGNGPFYVKAYDRFGTQHTLSGTFPGATSSYVEGITYDPMNGYLYINTNGTENAYDANGNSESISFTSYSDRTFAYGPLHGWLYNGQSSPRAWDGNGTMQSPSGGFAGLSGNINGGYNGFNGWLYYTNVYPDVVVAYDQDGNPKTLTGPFTNVNSSNQPQAIAADPTTGHVYVLTNTGYLLAYDQNGNTIFTVSGLNDPSGVTTAPPP